MNEPVELTEEQAERWGQRLRIMGQVLSSAIKVLVTDCPFCDCPAPDEPTGECDCECHDE